MTVSKNLSKMQKTTLQKAAIQEMIGHKEYLTPHDYKVYNVLLTGYVPSDTEVKILFDTRDVLSLKEVEEIVCRKLSFENSEARILEIFRAFDADFKGYIDTSDLLKAWKSATPSLSWRVLHESFNELALRGNLDYARFKNICLTHGFN